MTPEKLADYRAAIQAGGFAPTLEAALELLGYIAALEVEKAAQSARIEELEKALRPFANFAPKVEQFVQGTRTFGGSPIFPTKDFRLADFAAAAKAMEK